MRKAFKALSIMLCTVLILQFTATVKSQAATDSLDFKILGSIGGPTSAIAVSGNYVYVGKGMSIIVLENTRGRLTQVGQQLNLPSFVSDLKIEGKTLYTAAGSAGLHIVDISDPLKPTEKGVYPTQGFAESIAVKGNTVYLASGIEGLQIIDVSDPARPTAVGQAFKGRYAFGVAISGNNACMAAGDDGLLTVDISKPAAPRELAVLDTPGIARNVALSGKYAFVADDWKGIAVIDISNPIKPVAAKTINTAGRAHGVALDKGCLYVADAYMGLRIFDVSTLASPKDLTSFIPRESQMIRVAADQGLLFCVDRNNGILCFDISKPSDLKLMSFYSHAIPVPLYLPKELEYWDNGKEIARLVELGVLDSGKIDPVREITRAEFSELLCKAIRSTDLPKGGKARFTDVPVRHWAYGYIEKAFKLGLISSRDKTHFDPEGTMTYGEVVTSLLRLVNREPKTGLWPENCIREAEKLGIGTVLGRFDASRKIQRANAFAMMEKVITEVTDTKTKTTLLQSKFGIQLQASAVTCKDVLVKGGYAFTLSGNSGFSVIDVNDPANPKQAAYLDFPIDINYLWLNGNYIYVPENSQLFVIDISDPVHPVWSYTSIMPSSGPCRGIAVEGDKMYIADEWGLKIISLKVPAKPQYIKHYMLKKDGFGSDLDETAGVAVRNGIAYITSGFGGIKIYDVSDPVNMKYIGKFGSTAGNIQFNGARAYVYNIDNLKILDINDLKNPKLLGELGNVQSNQYNLKLAFINNLLFIPNDSNGVFIADVSDPVNIRKAGSVDTVGTTLNAAVSGDNLFVSDSLGGMAIIGRADRQTSSENIVSGANISSAVNASFSINTSLFKGLPAEKYVLNGEKAEFAIRNERSNFVKTLTVINTNDSGMGSLRWCMENIVQDGRIVFDAKVFPPVQPAVINSCSTLYLDKPGVTIDASNAGVVLDGSHTSGDAAGIFVNSDYNVIKGLKIQNYKGMGMEICGSNNIIGGSRLKGKGPSGEGNVIIRCNALTISGQNATDNIIVGNNIGIDADGKTPAGNLGGVNLLGFASRNTIGIDKKEYRNVVSCNKDRGISTMGWAFGNLIEGNYVGTDVSGTIERTNNSFGITFEICGFGSIVRNNVTCGNGRAGVLIGDGGCNFNVVVGNSIGIGADGTTRMRNYEGGLGLGSGFYNIAGGRNEGLSNRIFTGNDELISFSPGIYDTVVDGKVYKYMNTAKY